MLLSFALIALVISPLSTLSHDLNPVVPCSAYDNDQPPAGVSWYDAIELSDVLDATTDDTLDWIRGRKIEIHPEYNFWSFQDIRASVRNQIFYLTAQAKSIPNKTLLKAEWSKGDNGDRVQWKFNFIGVDDKIISSYWLNTLDQCEFNSTFYLQDVKAITVNPRNYE
jgi:hypothetical protein